MGGQHRLRYEWQQLEGGVQEGVLLSRNLLHLDLHVLPALRVFFQLGGHYALGAPDRVSPPDVDLLDVQQLFVEVAVPLRGVSLVARVGRQEMPLGSTRWVSTRDGTNVRQSFDLLRLSVTRDGLRGETFFGFVPVLRRGVLDDAPAWDQRFWGSYWTLAVLSRQRLSLDVFYLGRDRPQVSYRELSGRELRHTLGLRPFAWNFNVAQRRSAGIQGERSQARPSRRG